jgi:glycosyltransferase involved in cell wall biosynthesis
MDKTKIHVIPSGLDLSRFTHGIDQAEARKMLELPSDPIIVGLSGRFDPFKGQLLLLEAVQRLQMPDLCICFLGEPTKGSGSEYTDTLLSTIDAYGLGDKVFIRPFRKDIEVFYAAIDLFVMASKAETFGMVTIEAMASGVPVIASNSGGSPEILNFGKLGRLFAPLLAESLAEEIRAVCEGQHADKETLLAAARIYDHHRVCEMVEQTLRL